MNLPCHSFISPHNLTTSQPRNPATPQPRNPATSYSQIKIVVGDRLLRWLLLLLSTTLESANVYSSTILRVTRELRPKGHISGEVHNTGSMFDPVYNMNFSIYRSHSLFV
ncbi:hypothetical protein POVWA2_025970 [Plasmodium ovale wallikeri]|uniref:Uncharacterized protein n=1 Tax=Plasmodium ovale wallikeri TaxID=864142 RepID=A0A1A8YUI9_PLAOA|nr:hypothetical protein POVWA1_026140 [Plasmodium ovale wallikeri]SBT35635.1 hypothetical protein POVWA2_025970 [Plasmodium ovale wallikeri]